MSPSSARGQQGFTIVELLVVMVLLGIVGSVVTTSLIQGLQKQAATTARLDAMHELERAVQYASRDLRAANPFMISTSQPARSHLAARVDRGGEWLEVTYSLEDGPDEQRVLVQTTRAPDQPVATRQLVTQVREDATEIFRYLDQDGREIRCVGDPEDCAPRFIEAHAIVIRLERLVADQSEVVVETVINVRNIRYGG